MTKLEAIAKSKTFRKEADELLQRMKEHKKELTFQPPQTNYIMTREEANEYERVNGKPIDDLGEVVAQHTLSIRDLESCIMRQGMALKYIGAPNPYPESKNPESPVVEPTADGLKM